MDRVGSSTTDGRCKSGATSRSSVFLQPIPRAAGYALGLSSPRDRLQSVADMIHAPSHRRKDREGTQDAASTVLDASGLRRTVSKSLSPLSKAWSFVMRQISGGRFTYLSAGHFRGELRAHMPIIRRRPLTLDSATHLYDPYAAALPCHSSWCRKSTSPTTRSASSIPLRSRGCLAPWRNGMAFCRPVD